MTIHNFKNQSYSKLKKRCQAEGKLFIDPEFPPEAKSMYYSQAMAPESVEWKRPKVWFYILVFTLGFLQFAYRSIYFL